MKKKKRIVFLLSLLCSVLLITSCNFIFKKTNKPINKTDEEPVYTPDYAWQLQLEGRRLWSQAYTDKQYLYLLEFIEDDKSEKSD